MAENSIIQASKYPWLNAFLRFCPDKLYIRIKWIGRRMPYRLNLANPRTFSEKLQWIKLYDHNPLYTLLVDKYLVKDYVAQRIGKEHVIPLLGVWDKVEDIEWDNLPNQFVLKTNHDCGGLVICKNKSFLNFGEAKAKLQKSMNHNYFYDGREWPYKNVQPKVFAEAYMEDEYGELRDYKFFCFNGEPKFCQLISGRGKKMCIDFFDHDWKHQPFHEPSWYPFADIEPSRPKNFEQMWVFARKLAEGKPFSRIDFYDVSGHIYFGEITFFPTGGMGGFDPIEWDYTFGSWIKLPTDK